jgi:hypothetical protein
MLFIGSGEVGVAGGAWSSTPPTIAAAEVRAVYLGLCAFAHRLEDHIAMRVDNTTVQHTLLKKSTKLQGLHPEFKRVLYLLRTLGLSASHAYVLSENNPADALSRGQRLSPDDLTTGAHLRMGALDTDL